MTEFATIRAAIKAKLDPLNEGSLGDWIEVSAYQIADPTPPLIHVVGIAETEFDVAMGNDGGERVAVLIEAVMGTITDLPPQENLDRLLMGELSVRDLLTADRTLGGTVASSHVSQFTGHRITASGTNRVLTAVWTLDLLLED